MRAVLVIASIVMAICVARMDALERAVWRLSVAPSSVSLARLSPWAGAIARIAIGTCWPLYAAIDPDWPIRSWHEGLFTFYALVCNNASRVAACRQMTKDFWQTFFERRGIPVPRMYARVINGQLEEHLKPQDDDDPVLVKPNDSCCGRQVSVAAWNTVVKSPPAFDAVVQQYVANQPPTSLRVVTCKTPTGHAFVLQNYRIVSDVRDSVASNTGRVEPLPPEAIRLAPTLCRCHTEEFANMPAITWDLVIDARGSEYVLEGNVPGAVCWKHECRATLRRFDELARQWL